MHIVKSVAKRPRDREVTIEGHIGWDRESQAFYAESLRSLNELSPVKIEALGAVYKGIVRRITTSESGAGIDYEITLAEATLSRLTRMILRL